MNTKYLILLAFLALTNCKKEIQNTTEQKKRETATTITEDSTIEVEIHARVNTANKEIEEIATLWTNYLNSQPDQITDNPFWNEEEKALYSDFDLLRNLLYPFPAGQLAILIKEHKLLSQDFINNLDIDMQGHSFDE